MEMAGEEGAENTTERKIKVKQRKREGGVMDMTGVASSLLAEKKDHCTYLQRFPLPQRRSASAATI